MSGAWVGLHSRAPLLMIRDDDAVACRREKKTSKMRTQSKLIDQLPSHKASKAEARGELVCAICLENIRAQQVIVPTVVYSL